MTNHDSQTIAVRERFGLQEDHPAAMASRIKPANKCKCRFSRSCLRKMIISKSMMQVDYAVTETA